MQEWHEHIIKRERNQDWTAWMVEPALCDEAKIVRVVRPSVLTGLARRRYAALTR